MTSSPETIFVASGFVAKYREGGGNFSVPLQYLTGLRRLGKRGIWLELLPRSDSSAVDQERIGHFIAQMELYELEYCLLLEPAPNDKKAPKNEPPAHHLEQLEAYGVPLQELHNLAPNSTLLNLSYSLKPPLLQLFGKKLLCSLDPTEVVFWMDKMEMGQSFHDEFWSVGLCMDQIDSRIPASPVRWHSYFPLVDTELLNYQPLPPKEAFRFTTIGQWYWDGCLEIAGQYPDFSKKAAFEPYLSLPQQLPEVTFELAMNLNQDDPERERLQGLGWQLTSPHQALQTPQDYYHYLINSLGEFTAVKLESKMHSGWLSDRAAAFLSIGRPVITEPTGAEAFLPSEAGLFFVSNLEEALESCQKVLKDPQYFSQKARNLAIEYFDATKNLQKML